MPITKKLVRRRRRLRPSHRGKKSRPLVAAKLPAWSVAPGGAGYYINSVATSSDGNTIVGGTFFHSYSALPKSARLTDARPASARKAAGGGRKTKLAAGDPTTFGTYCYDKTGRLRWKDEFTGWQGVYWVDVARDGSRAASGGWYSNDPYAGFVRAYDAATGARLLDYRTGHRVNQVALSSDGSWLISAAETLVLFQLVDGAYVKRGEFTPGGTDNMIVTAALSADGTTIVCGDYAEGKLYVLGNASGTLTTRASWTLPQKGYSHCVRITPDGTSFAAGGAGGYFYLFEIATLIASGKPTLSYQVQNNGSVYGVAISDDGSTIIGISNLQPGSDDGGMVYCLVHRGCLSGLIWSRQIARNPNCASINLAAGIAAVADGHPDGSPGNFYLLDVHTGDIRWQYTTGNMSWPIMISGNGQAIVAGSDDAYVYYFTPTA